MVGAIGSALYGAIRSGSEERAERGLEVELLTDLVGFFRSPLGTLAGLKQRCTESDRLRRAVRFAVLMIVVWFVLQIPLFSYAGVGVATLRGTVFFVFHLVVFLITVLSYGFLLHFCLRAFRVRSVLPVTLSIFLYFTAAVPIREVLSVPDDLVEYWVVQKTDDPLVVLHPDKYTEAKDQVLSNTSRIFRFMLRFSRWATNLFVLFAFSLLAVALAREFETRRWRTLCATAVVVLLVSGVEIFVLNPMYWWIDKIFSTAPP